VVLLSFAGWLPSVEAEEVDGEVFRIETEHLTLEWVETPDTTEVKASTAKAKKLYEGVAALLDDRSGKRITIIFGGPAERPGGEREYPRVDPFGRILLFRFTPDFNNYFGALAHELVHAFRFERRFGADWFFEEGFAEFVALRADPSLDGYPWFAFPITVVAGQWVAAGEDIPLSILRERHKELNLLCGAQSYALRSAFFDWLGKTYGDDAVFTAAGTTPAGALLDYEEFFESSFGDLEREWRAEMLLQYQAYPGGAELAKKYRTESPIQYQHVCTAGEDF
jgi:hypothetical protein